ncbi:hypothetical protein [Neisseria lactamica]|uniref:Phage associated protein n=1 Tax=Neisseria lactamica TaxID=486 RepID=A0AAU8VFN8_NEILA|nr:hypothetical protein [Neisseria lactamica]ARB04470.1 hypothetical protein B2G52_05825 [Neisseria lactamica]CBX23193.1 unnamed protein product [Neisseria lactamica Y92-1009]
MSQENERKQGFFVTASFDRAFVKERKNADGTYVKVHYLGLLVRSDDGTQLCEVRTKHPEKYQHLKRDQVVTMEIHSRAFKDNVYYSDER